MTDQSAVTIPTAEEITAMLGEGGVAPATVIDVRAEPLAVQGALCDLHRLTLQYEPSGDGGPATLVAKVPTTTPDVRVIGVATGVYRRELGFYSQLAGRVPMRVPRCYFAGDGDIGEKPLLLEDLSDLRAGDQVAGFAFADAVRVIDALAELHAAFWDHPDLESSDFAWLTSIDDPMWAGGVSAAVAGSVELFRSRYGDVLEPGVLDAAARAAQDLPRLLAACDRGPRTLVHFDTRADNWMFAEDGTPVLVDWQTVGRVRGMHDIAYLLSGSVAAQVQQDRWETLVRRYYEQLTSRGVSGLSWDDCLQDYRDHVAYASLLSFPLLGPIAIQSERGQALVDAVVVRSVRHASQIGAHDD